MPVLSPAERLVKCPTAHCPGWIAIDDRRPQTVPCRYCRVTTHTLAYLLSQGDVGSAETSDAALVDLQDPALHATFNGLMLALAGNTGGNVYLRPTDRALVTMTGGPRGVILEYNAALAGGVSAAAMVGLLMHRLLHVDIHPHSERIWRADLKPGGRQDLAWLTAYLPPVVDHAWLEPLLDALAPGVRAAMQAWGMDVALMLSGTESFFPSFMGDRTRREMAAWSADPTMTAEAMREALVDRLAELTAAAFGQERSETNRLVQALQIADLHTRHPEASAAFVAGLQARDAQNLREAQPLAERLQRELADARGEVPADTRPDNLSFKRGLEGALKALNVHTAFDVRAVKATE
jgi:hypothetical protein